MSKFSTELVPDPCGIGGSVLVLLQKLMGIARPSLHCLGILDIEVVVPGFDVLDAHLPSLVCLLAFAPPLLLRGELRELKRLGLRVALRANRIGMLVEPDVRG